MLAPDAPRVIYLIYFHALGQRGEYRVRAHITVVDVERKNVELRMVM